MTNGIQQTVELLPKICERIERIKRTYHSLKLLIQCRFKSFFTDQFDCLQICSTVCTTLQIPYDIIQMYQ